MHRQEAEHLQLDRRRRRPLLQHGAQLLHRPLPLLLAGALARLAVRSALAAAARQERVLQLAHVLLQAFCRSRTIRSRLFACLLAAVCCRSLALVGLVLLLVLGSTAGCVPLQLSAAVALQRQRNRDAHLCWVGWDDCGEA